MFSLASAQGDTKVQGPRRPKTDQSAANKPGKQQKPKHTPTISMTTSGRDDVFIVDGVEFKMLKVDGGQFMMGAHDNQRGGEDYVGELPLHQVSVDGFNMSETPVTQGLWRAVMGENPPKYKGPEYPAEVSWEAGLAFVKRLDELTGKKFRYPTEAEWEFAARGGNKSQGYKYAGSDNLDEVAWYWDNSDRATHPVAQKRPNELGLYDMTGNVGEWCSDWYAEKYYEASPSDNPQGPASGTFRIFRGHGWAHEFSGCNSYCRTSMREHQMPDNEYVNIGIRLVY